MYGFPCCPFFFVLSFFSSLARSFDLSHSISVAPVTRSLARSRSFPCFHTLSAIRPRMRVLDDALLPLFSMCTINSQLHILSMCSYTWTSKRVSEWASERDSVCVNSTHIPLIWCECCKSQKNTYTQSPDIPWCYCSYIHDYCIYGRSAKWQLSLFRSFTVCTVHKGLLLSFFASSSVMYTNTNTFPHIRSLWRAHHNKCG